MARDLNGQNGNMDQEKGVESVPAPAVSEKKRKLRKGFLYGGVAAAIAAVSFFGGFCARWFSIEKEMRTLIDVKDTIDREYYRQIPDEEFYGAIFDVVNNRLLDRYSEYMTADEYETSTSDLDGNRIGIGLVFLTADGAGQPQLLVTRVCGNSPAEEAGIEVGTYVVGFGKDQAQMTDSVVYDELYEFLSGCEEGETFYLKVLDDGETETVPLSRKAYVENYVFYRTNAQSYTFTGNQAASLTERGEPLSVLDDDTAYVRLIQFTGNAASEFKQAMKLFRSQGKKNLVLDLRDNGGGYLDVMQEIASYFCKNSQEKKPVVAVADYGEKREKFKATGNVYDEYFAKDSRICVLADRNSASASECLLGCMLDYGAIGYADICLSEWDGEAKTFGKGIMQTTYYVNVFEQNAIKLTTAQIRWPLSDTCIHDRGILASDGTKTVLGSYEGETELQNAIKALF